MKQFVRLPVLLAALFLLAGPLRAQPATRFGPGAGAYGELFDALKTRLQAQRETQRLNGRDRTIFVPWIRDQVHVMKAMKFFDPDVSSFLELYLETQTPEGIYFDYFYPITEGVSHRMNLFAPRYWRIFPRDTTMMHRLPVEADLEYLMVEGAYHVWQATGDTAFVRRWMPALERGMRYAMTDPLRWSARYRLVKRAYTLDTWDFLHLHPDRATYSRQGGDVQEGIFDIDEDTPMGIMHGDNSGMYAASRQLAALHRALGQDVPAEIWDHEAELFRLRTNACCWNGRFYAHFVEDDPQPAYYTLDQQNTLTLSNPYDVNRGLPTGEMAASIIQTYLDLKTSTADTSFAEWYSVYPAVVPHFSDYEPGSYMNGGVNTIVAGELAKAALQHGYEAYGVDILHRVLGLVREHGGDLPVAYRPDGTVDAGIPDNWGQAAVMSALVEGLAGVVDQGAGFEAVAVSPRWLAAGREAVDVTVAYGPSGRYVGYTYTHMPHRKTFTLQLEGDPQRYTVRLLLPPGVAHARARVDGRAAPARMEQLRDSHYLVLDAVPGGEHTVEVRY